MPHVPQTPAEYWDTYMPHREQGTHPPAPRADRFEWTQYPGHGPGHEILGTPRSALDLGPAEGKEAVYLARHGIQVTGVDLSPAQVIRARRWWHDVPGLDFIHADAVDHLTTSTSRYDAVYSVWGALWFTDPEQLLPLIARRLTPGGVLAFSHAEPAPGAYGPQPMRGKWLEDRQHELTVLRWQYTHETWADLLKRHGFTHIKARTLPAPEPGKLGTLIIRAHSATS